MMMIKQKILVQVSALYIGNMSVVVIHAKELILKYQNKIFVNSIYHNYIYQPVFDPSILILTSTKHKNIKGRAASLMMRSIQYAPRLYSAFSEDNAWNKHTRKYYSDLG